MFIIGYIKNKTLIHKPLKERKMEQILKKFTPICHVTGNELKIWMKEFRDEIITVMNDQGLEVSSWFYQSPTTLAQITSSEFDKRGYFFKIPLMGGNAIELTLEIHVDSHFRITAYVFSKVFSNGAESEIFYHLYEDQNQFEENLRTLLEMMVIILQPSEIKTGQRYGHHNVFEKIYDESGKFIAVKCDACTSQVVLHPLNNNNEVEWGKISHPFVYFSYYCSN